MIEHVKKCIESLASHAEESHLRVLPEPCMSLSTHTAPDVRPLPYLERLCLVHGLLPLPVGPGAWLNNAAPSVQPHYRAFVPTTSCSAPVPRIGTLVLADLAAWTPPFTSGRQVLNVPYKSLIRLRAAYMPDAARAAFRPTPELIPEARRSSGFDITSGISTRHQRFAFARLSGPYLTGSRPAFCCNAHHNRF